MTFVVSLQIYPAHTGDLWRGDGGKQTVRGEEGDIRFNKKRFEGGTVPADPESKLWE